LADVLSNDWNTQTQLQSSFMWVGIVCLRTKGHESVCLYMQVCLFWKHVTNVKLVMLDRYAMLCTCQVTQNKLPGL
jgi:hypothetical protein